MNTRYLQRGMGAGQILLLLAAIGFGSTLVISIVPVYIDNSTVISALQSVQEAYEGKDIGEISDREIRSKLGNYFQINLVSREIEEAISIVREKDDVRLMANYEIRKHFVANVDLVMVFENEVLLGQ